MTSGRLLDKCSFCFKTQDEVRLIAGPNVFICEDCVGLCKEAFKDDSDDPRIKTTTGVIQPLR